MAELLLNKVLQQVAAERNFLNYELQIEANPSGRANYTSNLYNVTIKEGCNNHHLFAKVAAFGEKTRSQMPKLYETEILLYTKLAKVYDALQREHNVPLEHRLIFTKFYGCNPTEYEETIVLENLIKDGYQSYNRFKPYDWEYAAAAVTELAKFHALSFAYREYHPMEFNKFFQDINYVWNYETGFLVNYFNLACAKAMDAVHETTRGMLETYFQRSQAEIFSNIFTLFSRTPVLAHGDFRPSNLLHKINIDGKLDIKIVDFQAMQGCSPVIDVLYFLISGSDGKFREQYYEKLLDHYYNELQAAMRRLHLDPEKVYSKADFDYEWNEKLPYGLTFAVFLLPIVLTDAKEASEVDKELEITSTSINKTSYQYVGLLNDIVNDYVKWGILQ